MRGGRFLAFGAICVTLGAVPHGASAAGGKALDGSYFFGECTSDCLQNTTTIAGQPFHGTEVILQVRGAYHASISLNARRLPGYDAVTFLLGCNDHSDIGGTAVLQILGDGRAPLGKYTVTQGQPARQAIVPFKGHGALSLVTQGPGDYKACYVTLANPLAITLGSPGSAAVTVTPARGAAGAQETILAPAPTGTQASAIVTYASGQQQLVGPTLVGSDGHATLKFTVAQGASGTARVTVVTAAKTLETTFTIAS
jgi:hypothetical protein